MQKRRHLLDGYTVLDFTQALAGPTVTRLMVEMGAEIIKVELPPKGDSSHGWPYLKNGRSGYYVQQNRGKKSLCVDVKKPEGLALIKQLVPKVDVLIENFAPGAIGRMGLSYEEVSKLNPQIVMCSMSGFGQTGPLASDPAYDFVAQAYAGVTYMIGEPDGSPCLPMVGLGDVNEGSLALGGIACALLYRASTGEGQYLDVALLDAYFHCHEMNVHQYSASGGQIKPKRSGAHHPQFTPLGVFKGKEGYMVIIAAVDHQWADLCKTMGRPDLIDHEHFKTNGLRVEHKEELVKIIEQWIQSMPGDEAALEALRKARVPVAPVLSIEQAVNHPHHRARGTVRTISDPIMGDFLAPGFPLHFSSFPERLSLVAPTLGQHNLEVLNGYLGMSEQQVRELEAKGILHRGNA